LYQIITLICLLLLLNSKPLRRRLQHLLLTPLSHHLRFHLLCPSAPSFEVAQDPSPSAPILEIAQPYVSTVPPASKKHQPSQDLIPQRPSLAQVYRRNKRKGKAQETGVEDQAKPLVELPHMEIEDNPPIIQAKIDTPALRRSSRRKLVLA
jgi:hypothetical protein